MEAAGLSVVHMVCDAAQGGQTNLRSAPGRRLAGVCNSSCNSGWPLLFSHGILKIYTRCPTCKVYLEADIQTSVPVGGRQACKISGVH